MTHTPEMKLPHIRPRKEEVAEIKAILEAGASDADAMARAVVAATYARLLDRDWFLLGMRNDGANLLYGLFGTEAAALKAMPGLGLFGECRVFTVRSLSNKRARLEAVDAGKATTICDNCQHQEAAHMLRGKSCAGKGCNCKKYIKN